MSEKAAPLCGSSTVWASHSSWYPFTIQVCIRTKSYVALNVIACAITWRHRQATLASLLTTGSCWRYQFEIFAHVIIQITQITDEARIETELQCRICIAKAKCSSMNNLFTSRQLGIKLKLHIFNCYIMPIFTYGWAVKHGLKLRGARGIDWCFWKVVLP